MRRILFMSAAAFALVACSPSTETSTNQEVVEAPVPQTESEQLYAWFETKYEEALQTSPMQMTQLGRKDRYNEIDQFSLAAAEQRLQWQISANEEMKATFDYEHLSPAAKVSFDLWDYQTQSAIADKEFWLHSYNFEQMGGAQSWLPNFLINFHRVDTEEDMLAYIDRVTALGRAYDQLLENTKASAERGIRPPLFAFEGALDQARKVKSGAPFDVGAEEDSALWADLLNEIKTLEDDGKIEIARAEELRILAKSALLDKFAPSYQAVIDWLEEDMANASEMVAAGDLPNGEAYYNHRLADQTTTELTADEIHEIGLADVARLRGEMLAVKDEFGFQGSLQQFFTFLRDTKDDERLYYPNTDEGRQGYLDDSTAAIERIKAELPNYFGLLPKADLIVKRVEPFREQPGAAQHYNQGTPDGSRPGVYYAHLIDMTAMPKRELEVIAYHEGLPGHHMQVSIAQELTGVPEFQKHTFYNAYVEGWALYSETLASEMPGTFQDPLSEFGRLGSEMWRAIRLVVDTGLHSKGWSEQQAVDYFLANSAITEAQARSEIRRYIAWPGQATGYKIGMIKILELRERARTTLGDAFDIREFHDVILGEGSMPLAILERRVDEWIADKLPPEPVETESEATEETETVE